MAAPKGHTFATGRPKGAPNKIKAEVKQAYKLFVENHLDDLELWLQQVAEKDPAAALDFMLKFSEYFIPKLARTEMAGEEGKPLIILSLPNEHRKSLSDQKPNSDFEEGIIIPPAGLG